MEELIMYVKALQLKLQVKLIEPPATIGQAQEFRYRQPIIEEIIEDLDIIVEKFDK